MATLKEVFEALFPISDGEFEETPRFPPDLFAFSAHLLERSGAYHHIVPEGTHAQSEYRHLSVTQGMRARAVLTGNNWRRARRAIDSNFPVAPARVKSLWKRLVAFADELVFQPLDEEAMAPEWWIVSLELMMIADEAARDIGFNQSNPFGRLLTSAYLLADDETTDKYNRLTRAPFSLSSAVEDILCVQPKSRTPSVGCTLRSLSHHLALLPPRGQVRARWVQSPFHSARSDDNEMSLLLVPFPYKIDDRSFESVNEEEEERWGWFRSRQTWLPSNNDQGKRRTFVTFVTNLIETARREGRRINGVVLPELALNYTQFRSLAHRLARDPEIDFMISGTSYDENYRSGNYVSLAPFFLFDARRRHKWESAVLVREKHHRWKLDSRQIDAYNLSLDREKNWWEDLTILSRSLDVLVYRGTSTLTTLICEDLARVDPCQAVVRAIGPNLLIALLMDGPQLETRWPARYASVLADDPGTSVLSFTSFGLIDRQNRFSDYPQASAIGLWKDQVKGTKVIELSRDADAVVLTLESRPRTEYSLDGRSDGGDSVRWVYKSESSVILPPDQRPAWITLGQGKDSS